MNADNETGPKNPEPDETLIDSGRPAGDASATNDEKPLPLANCVRWMVLGEKTMAAFFLLVIVSTMAAQVFARYVFGAPFQWSEEVARLALIWLTFISAAFVMAERRHIAVDMISSRVGDSGKLLIECLSYLVVAVSCLLLLIGGANFVWYVGKVGSPALGVPKSWWYGAGMVGLLLMAVHSLVNLFQVWKTGKPIPRETHVEEDAFQLELEQSE
ncbi:TRAP transporter small permease [bacterium]|nr:TRAP transporter small permease [Rubripirellula sp.]MDB4338499.1 TRAP transporter small permease [Rubripirellula sp.]MDC0279178.1 TRAP transporter small permease [bacterium]